MRVLIISDTHGRLFNLKKVIDRCGPFDHVIHAGDFQRQESEIKEMCGCSLTMVKGNGDGASSLPLMDVACVENDRILVVHGHRHMVAYDRDYAVSLAKENGCNMLVCGHTHMPFIDESDPDVTVMNPGSLTRPRQIDARPSFIVLSYDRQGNHLLSMNYL
ncbi:MAG: YfcE family phosphodiesterase [Lachnospiraceae bacterium]|nr:YfcE family phosphodiesterase [Candidatus Equihabitans merdae]